MHTLVDRTVGRNAHRSWRRAWLVGLLAMGLVAGCASTGTSPSAGSSGGAPVKGGTATVAETAGLPPPWIFPLYPATDFTVQFQSQFEYLMVPPLYQFGSGTSPAINYGISLAYPPVYQNGDTQVVIKLKHYLWSDGTPVTARDVTFWLNELRAEKLNWAAYVPGLFPDNVTGVKVNNPYQLTLTLNKAYSPTWFTYNELAQITPMPQQSWDRTSASGAVGNYDQTTAGAKAVFQFLNAQSKDIATYDTNPLWKVVDGPWRLKTFLNSGYIVMTPNPTYSGPDKAHLAKLVFLPYDSEVPEVNAVKAGSVDVGYLPTNDASLRPSLSHQGYTSGVWPTYGFNSLFINFNNPVVGPDFKQLYVRQALERLINQPQWIKTALAGFGVPDYGPVVNGSAAVTAPIESPSQYPYAFSVSAAEGLLRAHGWKVVPGGVDSCQSPGTGPNQCGAGVAKGSQLSFTLIYQDNYSAGLTEMEIFKSTAAQAGIQINLKGSTFAYAAATPCSSTQSACSWQIDDWGGAIYTLPYYPAGGGYFRCGGALNADNYCDPTEVKLSNAAEGSGQKALFAWETYVTQQLPMLWIPNADYQLLEVKSNLHGVLPANPLLSIYPQNWYYTKG
ncbi:MAG: ABC transporter substrate-binding protein [Candidatus Dormibacteraeota bacterium]|nr:ABC transporter substrate-binding protein [Candidatus Dormibacteraeota bacterium]